jgi:hypothetical protein
LLAEQANSSTGRNSFPINAFVLLSFENTSHPNSTCQRMSHDLFTPSFKMCTIFERSQRGCKKMHAYDKNNKSIGKDPLKN